MSNHYPEPWTADGATIKALDHGKRFKVASAAAPRVTAEGQAENAKRIVACVNGCAGLTNPAAIPAIVAAAELVHEAIRIMAQPLTLSGTVSPESPGGQSTGHRSDGTPVDRHEFMREAMSALAVAMNRLGIAKG